MIDVLLDSLVPIFAVFVLAYLAGWIRNLSRRGDHDRLVSALTEPVAPSFAAGW